jgi:hypothetical protein
VNQRWRAVGQPWLPDAACHAAAQEGDRSSMLSFTQTDALRLSEFAFTAGDHIPVPTTDDVLASALPTLDLCDQRQRLNVLGEKRLLLSTFPDRAGGRVSGEISLRANDGSLPRCCIVDDRNYPFGAQRLWIPHEGVCPPRWLACGAAGEARS